MSTTTLAPAGSLAPHTPASREHAARMLRSRAESLVAQADQLPAPLAVAYRRRALELSREADAIDAAVLAD